MLKFNLQYIGYWFIGMFIIYMSLFSRNDINHISIERNYISGEVKINEDPGIRITAPWIQVVKIDIRPFKICVTSSSKVLNCGVYSFNKDGIHDFIKREGISYYWFRNRLSFNYGHREEYRGFVDIIKGYAFDLGKKYAFINYN